MSDEGIQSFLMAELGGQRIGLPVCAVQEIVRVVALDALPGAPPIVEGTMNLRGDVVPVLNLRARLGLSASPVRLSDNLIVLALGERRVAVRVDSVSDVREFDALHRVASGALSPALTPVVAMTGVAADEDGTLAIYDPAAFISQAEQQAMDLLLAAR